MMIVLRPKSLESRIESCLNLIRKKEKVYKESGSSSCQNQQVEKAREKIQAFVSFEEIRMMCYFNLTQHLENYKMQG